MGCSPSAELIWGIPITNEYEDDDTPSRFWDEDAEDWDEVKHFEIKPFGHYEDAWTPTKLNVLKLDLSAKTVQEYAYHLRLLVGDEKAEEMRASLGWHLVASYG